MPQDPRLNGRPLQWNDLSSRGRQIVSNNVRETGRNLPQIAGESADRLQATHERTGNDLARVKSESARSIQGELVSKPVSLRSAASARVRTYEQGIESRQADNPSDPHQVIPHGAGWYFDHHQDIAGSAERHGFPKDWAIAASGVMSPMNSPDNEKRAVSALMDAYVNHKVTVTPEVHQHLAKNGIDVSEHLGKDVHFDQLPVGSMAHLSDSAFRSKVPTTANLKDVSLGGTKTNVQRAEHILMGNVHPDNAVDPHSAPKVWSYIHNTRLAEPGSPTHVEFMGRVHQDALTRTGQIDKDQQALDLYGHNDQKLPSDHLLSPTSHTVEDTWQNAITFDQPKTMAGGRTSTFKAAGSLPETYPIRGIKTTRDPETGKRESAIGDARIGNPALTHAFNNKATHQAAATMSKLSGATVPPVAVQAVAWTEARKQAGKDPAFNQARAAERPAPNLNSGQFALFGEHEPGGQKTIRPEDHTATEPTGRIQYPDDMNKSDIEGDLRKHEAIYRARNRARSGGRILP